MLLIGRAQGGPRMPDEGDEVVLVPCCKLQTGSVVSKSRDAPNFFPLSHFFRCESGMAGREELCINVARC